MQKYHGEIAPCGIYCGGCPRYGCKSGCQGADTGCRRCKGIYVCCVEKKQLRYCYECSSFPCYRFKEFAKRWEKYGQNLIDNQLFIKAHGVEKFKQSFEKQVCG